MQKLAIITTHPIQYNAPLFKLLEQRGNIIIRVFYTWGPSVLDNKYDPGFGKSINWDIPLLEGYDHIFEKNIAVDPGSHHFKGIDNPYLVQHIKEWNAEAIVVYGWNFKSHLKCLRFFKNKIPVFFRGDSTLLNEKRGLKMYLRYFFLRWVYRHIDYALYVGINNKDYFIKFGLKKNQLRYVPHVVDNKHFYESSLIFEKEAIEWKKKLGIGENEVVFLYAGKIEAVKNLGFLLKAFYTIENENIHLIIAGNGHLEEELKMRYCSDKRIHFIPFQNQSKMPVLYRVCDVFVLPSLSETWGLSINEAMACSRAILVSDKCGCAIDLVKNGINGYIFNSDNQKDLTSKLKLLLKNKNELQKMGKSSFNIIQAWDVNAVASALEAALKETT